jgi:hypothetical protein
MPAKPDKSTFLAATLQILGPRSQSLDKARPHRETTPSPKPKPIESNDNKKETD